MTHYLMLGGPVLIPIALCSVWALTFIIIQWIRIRDISKNPTQPLSQLTPYIKKQDWLGAERFAAGSRHPFLKAWRIVFTLLIEGKCGAHDLEEAVSLEGQKTLAELESALKPLASLITVLPMLGFLGTILGLIVSFQNWELMGTQISISALAGGIYQAMITTAAGLVTAIPYSLAYHHFVAKVERAALTFSEETTKLIRMVKFSSESSTLHRTHKFTPSPSPLPTEVGSAGLNLRYELKGDGKGEGVSVRPAKTVS